MFWMSTENDWQNKRRFVDKEMEYPLLIDSIKAPRAGGALSNEYGLIPEVCYLQGIAQRCSSVNIHKQNLDTPFCRNVTIHDLLQRYDLICLGVANQGCRTIAVLHGVMIHPD